MSHSNTTKNCQHQLKAKFQENGAWQQVCGMFQANIVNLVRGDNDVESTALVQRPVGFHGRRYHRDLRIRLLNQLILEYFQWQGFVYSAEMLAREGDFENVVPLRICLEGIIGPRCYSGLPILIDLVLELLEKNQSQKA